MAEKLSIGDVLEIQELIALYAYYADDGDTEAFSQLFAHADLWVQGTLMASKDAALLKKRFSRTPRVEGGGRRHVTTNVIVKRLGPGLAAASSCFAWIETGPAQAPRILQCGVYNDRFEKVDGAWRFSERRAVSDGVVQAG